MVGVCNCSMFRCTLYVHSSIAIILMGKRGLIALLNLSSWCLVMVKRLFLTVPRGCLRFAIVVFPDHTHLLFFYFISLYSEQRQFTETLLSLYIRCSVPGVVLNVSIPNICLFLTFYTLTSTDSHEKPYTVLSSQIK